jgi:cellulose 1,4-beta-cellobiosidase
MNLIDGVLGYCDAQCPHDIKWLNGEANSNGWKPSDQDKNAGSGKYGSCCPEMVSHMFQ